MFEPQLRIGCWFRDSLGQSPLILIQTVIMDQIGPASHLGPCQGAARGLLTSAVPPYHIAASALHGPNAMIAAGADTWYVSNAGPQRARPPR